MSGAGPTAPKVLLVVEDEPGIRGALELLLELEGYRVVAAANGRDALARLADTPCDLILTDHMMPLMDGLSLLARLRDDPRHAGTPKILMSAVARRPEAVQALADLFLPKPFETPALLHAIESLLRRGAAPGSPAAR